MKSMAILTDVTKCIGCEECVAACKTTNQTGKDLPWRWQSKIDDLSASRWTTIIRRPHQHYVRQQCRHCLAPACVSVCPVGALKKTPEGPVTYDSNICMGCRYCMMACPFAIPRYLWSEPVPYVRKCIMCHQKIKNGELTEPACTKACPQQATIYGERDQLLAEAHQRIKDNPKRYINRVWGEKELGGSSVLYLSDIPLDFLAWQKDLPDDPLPEKVYGVLKKVPGIFVGVGLGMYGTWWIIERRERLKNGKDDPDRSNESTDNSPAPGPDGKK